MIRYILGESRELEFEVTHSNGEEFIIRKAEYSITLDGQTVESGRMTIDGHRLSVVFTPESKGMHKLVFFYTVADTTRGAQYYLNVE